MRLIHFTLCLIYLFGLSGCLRSQTFIPNNSGVFSDIQKRNARSLTHPQTFNRFIARGKVSFSDGTQGGHATLEWRQSHHHYLIVLTGPLGIGALQILGNPREVSLTTSKGQHFQASTPEVLIKQHLGWNIPVSPLQYWLQGLPAPGRPPSAIELDAQNQFSVLRQQGWTIHYERYTHQGGIRFPQKLLLTHGSLRLKFIFKNWQIAA